MATNIGILSGFDHNIQTWKTYKGRIEQWFLANDINNLSDKTGSKRRAILLSALSEDTYELATNLVFPKELQNIPYEDILLTLDTHFTPKRIGFSERHKFYTAVQEQLETPSQWAARLRGLSTYCSFSNLEETLRDRFIMGMLPGIEKEKIYTQELTDLTLAKVVDLAESLRSARASITTTANASSSNSHNEQQLFKINKAKNVTTSPKVKCAVCGYFNHTTSECHFVRENTTTAVL